MGETGIIRLTREEKEEFEEATLSPLAFKSNQSEGRNHPEDNDPYLTGFEVDAERILYSKAFENLEWKTQVFALPKGAENRKTHTLRVAMIAGYIARQLKLNYMFAKANALGHDVGHAPFGHLGERMITEFRKKHGKETVFNHAENSVYVLNEIEGLNLTKEVAEGILHHSWNPYRNDLTRPKTLESRLVAMVDNFYVITDIEDAKRADIIREEDLPKSTIMTFGTSKEERIITARDALMDYIEQNGDVGFSDEVRNAFVELTDFMFNTVYYGKEIREVEKAYARQLEFLYEQLPFIPKFYKIDPAEAIASMTDVEVLGLFKKYLLPDELA